MRPRVFSQNSAAGLAGLGFGVHGQTGQTQTAQQILSAPDCSQDTGVFFSMARSRFARMRLSLQDRLGFSLDEAYARAVPVRTGALRRIPPISRELPPGDRGIVASAGGKAMIALGANERACARFLGPDFVLSMLVQVGKGENGKLGDAI